MKKTNLRFLGLAGGTLMLAGCLTSVMLKEPATVVAEFTRPAAVVQVRSMASASDSFKRGDKAVVTADTLNIRSGPGTNYAKRGSLTRGYQVEILETSGDWVRIGDGWVNASHLGDAKSGGVAKGDTVTVTASSLNIRQGAGTGYARVGQLNRGARVEILEVKDGWGRIREGWISLKYVSGYTGGSTGNNGGGQNIIVGSKDTVGYVTADSLNVRSGPGTNYGKNGSLTRGYRVNVLEVQGKWARIDEGWVFLEYLNIADSNRGSISAGDTVRVNASVLNIRQGAGTGYARVGRLANGTQVEILEVKGSWGRISKGWISLNYVDRVSGTNLNIEKGDTVKVTADVLNIRQGAGTNYGKAGSLTRGYRVDILEVQGNWGRISNGWISLKYVVKA